jgi:UDP-2,3-diacylglucosamine hydrolase
MSAPAFDRAPVGLLAAGGRFPVVFAEKARAVGLPVVCVALKGMADPALAGICPQFHWLRRFALGQAIRRFRAGGVSRFVVAGKFYKAGLLRPWVWFRFLPDLRLIRLWWFRPRTDNQDDTLMLALLNEFRKEGLDCVSALDLCPELLVRDGVLSRRPPTEKELRDARFGWGLARKMGELDVGQSVMIRDRAVLAVEAIEGTDECIRRAGGLCGRAGFVVVKVAKPNQDMRFDVPTVGPRTIESMRAAGATALAIEAGRTILLDEAETLALADRHRIAVFAMTDVTVAATAFPPTA